jgi:hypothetical protein
MPKPASVRIPLKFFGEARKTVRAQFAAALKIIPAAAAAAEAGSPPADARPNARAIMIGFFRLHLQFLAAHPDIAEVLYNDAAPPSGERALQEHRKLMMILLAEFEKVVAAGKTARSVRADVDPAMAAVHCLGAIQMAWTFWTMGGRKNDLAQAGLNLFEQLWDGIKAQPGA